MSRDVQANESLFVYVTYIRTTPAELWTALTGRAFTERYWYGMHQESDFRAGSPWQLRFADGRVADTGEIVEADPPHRLVIRWRNVFRPELADEGDSLCTLEIEAVEQAVKLTVTHRVARPGSKFIEAVSGGWPRILSNLKTLLETGEVLMPLVATGA
ncbi:ATPase [Paraburkholderia sp. Ac-20340]|uniref:SRPBCC family protein n=1 Tax=Paraburkholderia sp. Ac-20340 TaxID=2703888 RepID=UPI00197F08EC|nr:SRPBCC family protein [Paraburkholderia sp. Ac-20340]MBN3852619.1 ATPase [Paraburkholderia sp. Ac-20340]